MDRGLNDRSGLKGTSIEVDDDVDGRDENLSGNEDYYCVSCICQSWFLSFCSRGSAIRMFVFCECCYDAGLDGTMEARK